MKTKMKLTPKVTQKQQLKTTMLYTGVGIALTSIIGVLAFFYLNLGNNEDALASTKFSSRASGDWTNTGTWTGTRPSLSLGNKDEVDINASHQVVVNGNLNFDQNTTLRIYGTLVVTGNLTMAQGTNLYVYGGGILAVMGNYSADQHLEFINSGKIAILGNIATQHQSTITNTGVIYADAPLAITSGSPKQPEENIQHDPQLMAILQLHGYAPIVMPVTLLSFGVENSGNVVNVNWSTANEKNNDFFTVERSTDGKNFEIIGKVNGAGNSMDVLKYSFTDHAPLNGRSFYRLKQTDYDGEFEYFDPGTVNRKSSDEELKVISVSPNPFTDQFTVAFNAEIEGKIELHLINIKGEQVATENFSVYPGPNKYNFTDGYRLPKDIYFLRMVQNGKVTKSLRIIKK